MSNEQSPKSDTIVHCEYCTDKVLREAGVEESEFDAIRAYCLIDPRKHLSTWKHSERLTVAPTGAMLRLRAGLSMNSTAYGMSLTG